MFAKKVMAFLDEPSTKPSRYFSALLLLLIYVSVIQVVVQERFPSIFDSYSTFFKGIELFTLMIFSVEYFSRIAFTSNRLKYMTSFYGIIDALAVIPGLIGLAGFNVTDAVWLRVIKIFRLIRILKFVKMRNIVGGITGKLLPFFASAIAFKGVTVMLEGQSWWPEIKNLNIVIGVVGFALAVLLGTKLSVVNNRIYAIEDAVCRIVGALRDMDNNRKISGAILNWSQALEVALKSAVAEKKELIKGMREHTNSLEAVLEESGVNGPNTAGFHRDVSYLLHRATAVTPVAYDLFLKYVTMTYVLVVIFAVPGLTGLISSVLITYVLGGMYFLIDDMDKPLEYSDESFVDVRLDALEFYNSKT
ncbi:MAG: ion transporter [Gammaproteobacteria bacterium]|jgi:hypothetical protein